MVHSYIYIYISYDQILVVRNQQSNWKLLYLGNLSWHSTVGFYLIVLTTLYICIETIQLCTLYLSKYGSTILLGGSLLFPKRNSFDFI